jgi:hypothetical protein
VFLRLRESLGFDIRIRRQNLDPWRICVSVLYVTSLDLHSVVNWDHFPIMLQQLQSAGEHRLGRRV